MERFDMTARLTTGALFLAPLLLLASSIAYLNEGGINDGEIGGTLQVYAMGLMVAGVVALTGALRDAAPRAAGILLMTGLFSAAAGVGFGVESIWVATTGEPQLVESGGTVGVLATGIPGLIFPATFVALGILYVRTGVVPPALGWLLALGAVLFPAGRAIDIPAVTIASDLVFLITLSGIGRHLWRAPVAATSDVRRGVAAPAS